MDLEKKCKKGLQKIYPGKKVFIGNGIANMVRKQLFNDGNEQIQLVFLTYRDKTTFFFFNEY